MTTAPTQKQDRLKAHFSDHAPASHSKRWDDLWSAGDFLPWDRGCANPALIDALAGPKDLLPSPTDARGKRGRALVPGCGQGYDVALFAAHGYDSYGLEVSENAVAVSERYLKDPGEGPLEGEYKVMDQQVGRGAMKCLLGDFFEDAWLEGAGGLGEGFDVIYDNTVSGFLNADAIGCRGCELIVRTVPLRVTPHRTPAVGRTHAATTRARRRSHLPRVPDVQATEIRRPALRLATDRARGAPQTARGGDILRRGRKGTEHRPAGEQQGFASGCALEAEADTPGGHYQR
jgi:SAM-dependent methyltransferase